MPGSLSCHVVTMLTLAADNILISSMQYRHQGEG